MDATRRRVLQAVPAVAGAFERKMKLAKVRGTGTVTLRASGNRSDLDIEGENISVKST